MPPPTTLQAEAKEEFEIDEGGGDAEAVASVEEVIDKFTIEVDDTECDVVPDVCNVVVLLEVLKDEDSLKESSIKLLSLWLVFEVGGMSIVWVSLPSIKRSLFF